MRQIFNRLPAQVGLVALLVYFCTLSFGVTTGNLALAAKVAGWDWQPMVGTPLTWLCTLPLRILPAAWIPVALNFGNALCAALTLGILARSMELLPWLRPLETLPPWERRLPVVLAVVLCGCEFHFWQQATNASGEMPDVLVFAASVWCVLEFRAAKKLRWLWAAVFFWGLGMTQNWMMMVTLPCFAVWIVYLQPRNFLNWKFPLKLAGWGALGFSVYLLLPLANSLNPHLPGSFGEVWLASFAQSKQLLGNLRGLFWTAHQLIGMAVALFYFLTIVACLVRLPDEETENKSGLDQIQIWLFRGLRLGLLLLCVWLALDPEVGPRGILLHQLHFGLPLLSFDYLNGLAAGCLAGNLLLVRRQKSPGGIYYGRSGNRLFFWLEKSTLPMVLGLLLLAAAVLVSWNAPVIVRANHQPLSKFGELAWQSLPVGGGIVLSDYPEKLMAFQAAQARHEGVGWLAVDTRSLPLFGYRERLDKLKPGGWLLSTNRRSLTVPEQISLLDGLIRSNRVFYLHPSFGFYFETFYAVPTGTVFELRKYQTNSVSPPPLAADQLARNAAQWNQIVSTFEAIAESNVSRPSAAVRQMEKILYLARPEADEIPLLKEWWSLAVNARGVDQQRTGDLAAAGRCFTLADKLNTNNWIARANLFCNTNLIATNRMGMSGLGNLAGQLGSIQAFAACLGRFGPVDEAQFCFLLGNAFISSGLPRQAIQQLQRSAALAPDVLAPRLALAELYTRCQLNDQATAAIHQLREDFIKIPETAKLDTQLSVLEADICLSQTNLAGASKIYQSILQQHPADRNIENGILKAYVAIGDFTNAEKVVSGMLNHKPDDLGALLAKSGVLIQSGRAGEAIPVLDQILAQSNSLPAKVNRAIAYLHTTNTAAAKQEYLELQTLLPNPFFADLGLAEVALQERNTNQAVQLFSQCLTNAPSPGEQRLIRARIEAILQGSASTNRAAPK